MTIDQNDVEWLSSLPFVDSKCNAEKVEVIRFNLKKSPETKVTLIPLCSSDGIPKELIQVLQEEFNYVVEEGLTYPHHEVLDYDDFVKYWFSSFVAILLEGDYESLDDSALKGLSKTKWKSMFLGNFYIKPNYVGRCSHVCNAGFIVNHAKRGLGLGSELGSKYLIIAAKLGYIYSVFNLVMETNIASCRIWDSLDFEKIGYVKNVAILKGHDKLVGAYIYGKELR